MGRKKKKFENSMIHSTLIDKVEKRRIFILKLNVFKVEKGKEFFDMN